jgi:hypothetical protein
MQYLCQGNTMEQTPKKMVTPGFHPLKDVPTRVGEAGVFAEWAGFGGVAEWNEGNSIFALSPPPPLQRTSCRQTSSTSKRRVSVSGIG